MPYDAARFADTGFRPTVAVIAEHAQSDPDRIAIRQKRYGIWNEISWLELQEIIFKVATALLDLGITKDSKIGILSENRQEWVLAEFGIQATGAAAVGLYPTSPAAEIDHLVNSSDTEILFIEDQEQYDKIVELGNKLPKLRKLIVFDPKGLKQETYLDLISFDEFVKSGAYSIEKRREDIKRAVATIEPDDTALMVFTSGSTGLPKAAEISYANLHAACTLAVQYFNNYGPGTNILSYLPLCHIAEQNVTVVNALSGQMTMNFGESLRTVTLDLRDVAPEIFFGVPRIWEKMQAGIMVQAQTAAPLRRAMIGLAFKSAKSRSKTPRANWSLAQRLSYRIWDFLVYRHIRSYLGLGRCTFALSGAAPISVELVEFLRGIGLNLREVWGMTETTGAASIQPDWGACSGRVGRFINEVKWKIAEDGELLVKGPIVFKGYYNNEEATQSALIDGWLHTGDIAQDAGDNSISIVDRKKDIMINAAGKNLAPSLIENTMKASPFIKECIIIADKRPYVTALIQLDFETTRLWAESQNIAYTTFRSLTQNDAVQDIIQKEIDRQNELLARVEQVKKFWLLPKELDHDDGEVTATMKVRRSKIIELYAAEIEALYKGKAAA